VYNSFVSGLFSTTVIVLIGNFLTLRIIFLVITVDSRAQCVLLLCPGWCSTDWAQSHMKQLVKWIKIVLEYFSC